MYLIIYKYIIINYQTFRITLLDRSYRSSRRQMALELWPIWCYL